MRPASIPATRWRKAAASSQAWGLAAGMASVAARAGLPRESLYRALSPRGNPTLKTLLALVHATGLRLAVSG